MALDQDKLTRLSLSETRKAIRQRWKDLWTAQNKNCEDLRREWLVCIAKDKARAAGDPDWKKKMNRMINTAKKCAMNRKLTAIMKGPRGILDRIQVPVHDWFYSPKYDELYHFDEGVFEAYPSRGDNSFFTHHTLKVLPDDVELVEVALDKEDHIYITDMLPYPQTIWEDITSQERQQTTFGADDERTRSQHGTSVSRSPGELQRQPFNRRPPRGHIRYNI